jgi:hypothetical protein
MKTIMLPLGYTNDPEGGFATKEDLKAHLARLVLKDMPKAVYHEVAFVEEQWHLLASFRKGDLVKFMLAVAAEQSSFQSLDEEEVKVAAAEFWAAA